MYGKSTCCSIVALGNDETDIDVVDVEGSMEDKSLEGGADFVVDGNDSSVNPSPTNTALTSGDVIRQRFKMAFMAVVRTMHPSASRNDDPGE